VGKTSYKFYREIKKKKYACSYEVSMRVLVLFFSVCLFFYVRFIETHRISIIFLCVIIFFCAFYINTHKNCNFCECIVTHRKMI